MTQTELIQVITGAVGSFCFGILFRLHGKRLAAAALGGTISWALFVFLGHAVQSDAMNALIVAAVVTLYAEIMARLLKTPATPIVTTSLIPLIPGGSLYYTMAYAFAGDLDGFLARASTTLALASALALGSVIVTTISQMLFRKHSVRDVKPVSDAKQHLSE